MILVIKTTVLGLFVALLVKIMKFIRGEIWKIDMGESPSEEFNMEQLNSFKR